MILRVVVSGKVKQSEAVAKASLNRALPDYGIRITEYRTIDYRIDKIP